MSLTHPVFMEMLNSGCTHPKNIKFAFQTYIEFCEVHDFKNVDFSFCPELDMIYVKATQNEKEEFYVPISIQESITPKWIENVQKVLCGDNETKSINLVIRDVDMTSATYKITSALVPPLSPESSKKKRLEAEKKLIVKQEINKQRKKIYELASNLKE